MYVYVLYFMNDEFAGSVSHLFDTQHCTEEPDTTLSHTKIPITADYNWFSELITDYLWEINSCDLDKTMYFLCVKIDEQYTLEYILESFAHSSFDMRTIYENAPPPFNSLKNSVYVPFLILFAYEKYTIVHCENYNFLCIPLQFLFNLRSHDVVNFRLHPASAGFEPDMMIVAHAEEDRCFYGIQPDIHVDIFEAGRLDDEYVLNYDSEYPVNSLIITVEHNSCICPTLCICEVVTENNRYEIDLHKIKMHSANDICLYVIALDGEYDMNNSANFAECSFVQINSVKCSFDFYDESMTITSYVMYIHSC